MIISDISDHFSQFCVLKSIRDEIKTKKSKMRHFSRFSRDSFNVDLSNVDWNALLNKKKRVTRTIYFLLFITSLRN